MSSHKEVLDPAKALEKAIDLVDGVSAMSRILGISPAAVSQWHRAPAERVLQIEKATGGAVTRHALRPDIYPEEP